MKQTLEQRLQHWGFSWAGLRDNRHGEWWVLAQMALIAAHALPPEPAPATLGLHWPLALRITGAAVVVIGMVVGALGVLNLGESLSPLPEPIPGAALITEGAYGRCRHPLYQSLLLCSLGQGRLKVCRYRPWPGFEPQVWSADLFPLHGRIPLQRR